jgi:ABC-2 type transport system permease protein
MNKTYLIFRHEFLQTIKRIGFILLTLTLPVLALLGIGVFSIVSAAAKPSEEATRIGYIDEAGGFDKFTTQGNLTLVRFEIPEEATQAMINKDIAEYFTIPADFVLTGLVNRYTLQREFAPPAAIAEMIRNFISSNLLAGKVPATTIVRIEEPLNLVTTMLSSTGVATTEQGGFGNFIIPGIFSLLLMFALLFSSIYVVQSLSEEKENRLMEILLSTVSTRQLLTGKLLGLGAAGLVQVAVWVISLPLLLKLASSSIGGIFSTIQLPVGFLFLGVVYFVLGYSVFAVLSASVAAVTSTVQEAQGFASIYTLFSMAPLWCLSLLLLFPNSSVWIVFSIFPFSAPVLVMLRLGLTGIPAWQLIVSIAVLILCTVGGLFLAAKLLRTYVLMYGKRPSMGEIIRNLRS